MQIIKEKNYFSKKDEKLMEFLTNDKMSKQDKEYVMKKLWTEKDLQMFKQIREEYKTQSR